jgi:Flp pilus assembly protein TadD
VAQYRNGQFREAIASLEKSRSDPKHDPYNLFFLAMCHHQLGDAARARDCYDRALRWMKEHKLPAGQNLAELQGFQHEAEELLGISQGR